MLSKGNKNVFCASMLPSLVEQAFQSPSLEVPEGMTPQKMLQLTEAFWKAMKDPNYHNKKVPKVVETVDKNKVLEDPVEFDVCIVGGTLGIFMALVLQEQGYSVCLIERRKIQGRTQEWNISKKEFEVLIDMGLLTREELSSCVITSWEKSRISFHGGSEDIWVSGVLDIGVSPKNLIEILKKKFLTCGGVVLERTLFKSASTYANAVSLEISHSGGVKDLMGADDVYRSVAMGTNGIDAPSHSRSSVTCRLMIDCMGHYSSVTKQIRQGQPEEGMLLVIGGCMSGIPSQRNNSADLLATIDDSNNDMQFFWEAFPAEGGTMRTVYMFAYTDSDESRPSFTDMLDMYLHKVPEYQQVQPTDVQLKRILMGGFPCYSRNVPLTSKLDRVLQIGDASAIQSPLSFGGFATLVRHLPRLSRAVGQALKEDKLDSRSLNWINCYLPSLSVSWLYQRSMSIRKGQQKQGSRGWLPSDHINKLMLCNFAVMSFFGDRIMKPFVQDCLQAGALTLTMVGMLLKDPITISRVLFQVGPLLLLKWFGHFFALVAYSILHIILIPFRRLFRGYIFNRMCDAFEWGSGLDQHQQDHHCDWNGPEGKLSQSLPGQ